MRLQNRLQNKKCVSVFFEVCVKNGAKNALRMPYAIFIRLCLTLWHCTLAVLRLVAF